MSYATLGQVQSRIPKLTLAVTSRPSQADVQTFIDGRSSELDAALSSLGLATPVLAPAWFLAELVQLNAKAAAADALLAAFVTGEGTDRAPTGAWLTEYNKRLDQLRNGVGVPVPAAVAEPDRAPRSYWVDADSWARDEGGYAVPPSRPLFAMSERGDFTARD